MQIQYDPNLFIGGIVQSEHIQHLGKVSKLHAEITAKKDKIDMLLKMKEELKMLKFELGQSRDDEKGSGGTGKVDFAKMEEQLDNSIMTAQTGYMDKAVENYTKLADLPTSIVSMSFESPIDWDKSSIRSDLPLSMDTMKCDARWFMVDSKSASSSKHSEDVSAHIKAQLSGKSWSIGGEASYNAKRNQEEMGSKSKVASTLVITCMCTHKLCSTIAPCVYDVEKLVEIWNTQFPDKRLQSRNPGKMRSVYKNAEEDEERLYMIRGASYASAIVGTVTFVDESEKQSSLKAESIEKSFKVQAEIKSVFYSGSVSGGYSKKTEDEVMNMLSNQTVSIHFNLYVAGCIPNLKPQTYQTKTKMLQSFDNTSQMDKIKEMLEALNDGSTSEASVINAETMMHAFDNYLSMANVGDVTNLGVPVNYFVGPISKLFIVDKWMQKYFPDETFDDSNDDEVTDEESNNEETKEDGYV